MGLLTRNRQAIEGTYVFSWRNRVVSTVVICLIALFCVSLGLAPAPAELSRAESLPYLLVGVAAGYAAGRSWRTGAFRKQGTAELVVRNYFRTYVYPRDTTVVVQEVNSLLFPCYAPAVVLPTGRKRVIAPLQQWSFEDGFGGPTSSVTSWTQSLNRVS